MPDLRKLSSNEREKVMGWICLGMMFLALSFETAAKNIKKNEYADFIEAYKEIDKMEIDSVLSPEIKHRLKEDIRKKFLGDKYSII